MFKDKNIKLIVTDFDGIMTDGGVYFSSVTLEEVKKVSFKDIMAVSLAVKNGYKVGIISGEKSNIIDRVASKFNLEDVHMGVKEKAPVLQSIADKYDYAMGEVCYFGDDINDLEALKLAGVSVTVPGANYKVLELPDIIVTNAHGGDGAFREIVDLIIDSKK